MGREKKIKRHGTQRKCSFQAYSFAKLYLLCTLSKIIINFYMVNPFFPLSNFFSFCLLFVTHSVIFVPSFFFFVPLSLLVRIFSPSSSSLLLKEACWS